MTCPECERGHLLPVGAELHGVYWTQCNNINCGIPVLVRRQDGSIVRIGKGR